MEGSIELMTKDLISLSSIPNHILFAICLLPQSVFKLIAFCHQQKIL